jgi:hypothetical protein
MRRILLLLLIALPLDGKTLHWRSIDVQARLDDKGNLHVIEEQQMVFDGDWNGGERSFNLRGRQRLDIHRVSRIEDGREVELIRGDLDSVDHYDLVGNLAVRWRSRLPSDPPFDNRELVYRLDYTYRNILDSDEGQFVLWHDFGLPSASGPIESFSLDLQFDPVWNTRPVLEKRTALQPGSSVIVRRPLIHSGGLRPELYRGGYVVLGGFALGVALLLFLFVRDEQGSGRFAPVEPRLEPDLLDMKAEVAGAIWDASVGAPEVAATLARMTQEGKITTRVERKELFMRLADIGEGLYGYERLLVAKLFFDGNETDTKRIRKHYKSSGVDFAEIIRPGIERVVAETIPGWNVKTKRFRVRTHVISLIVAALLVAGIGFFGDPEDVGEAVVILAGGAIFGLIACGVASQKSQVIASFRSAFLVPFLLMMFPTALLTLGALRGYPNGRMTLPLLIACAIWLLGILRLALDLLKSREGHAVIAARRKVLALRQYFVEQLRLPQPALRDEWFPHLLAFGLGRHSDRWFRAFGGAAAATSSFSSGSGSSSSSSAASSSWSGGGGAFGGAGATGSWAVAAAAIGAGVATPSSSSGGGGGGGSSSGGGGGGGW